MSAFLSVLTPSLNYAHFLGDCLASVAEQHADDVEHVVADGGSTDGTVELLQRERGPVWFSEPDRGQSDALSKALARSSGEWIGWLNADEFYLPHAISALRSTIAENPLTDVVFGDYAFVDEAGHLLRLVPQHRFSRTVLRWYGPFIHNSAMFFKRSVLGDEWWDRGLRKMMDWDLMLNLTARGAVFVYVPQALGAYRLHAGQVTAGLVPITDPERRTVRERWGIPSSSLSAHATRVAGRSLHIALKLAEGAYARQLRAARVRNDDLRWFAGETAAGRVSAMLESIYGGHD